MPFNPYARWMFAWETSLTTRDTNRVVRPLEWGFDCLEGDFSGPSQGSDASDLSRMVEANRRIVERSDEFFSYRKPIDFRIEERLPELFPTNKRRKTLEQDARWKRLASLGRLSAAPYLRFTSPVSTQHSENDLANARWYPASIKPGTKPRQALIVMPQWNADAFSHNALCTLFNKFGISCLRLSKPFHDVRRPAELERSDYAVSANIGRTLQACRQAVVDVRCCIDWLEEQGYEQFGVLGTSLGSCYAFIAAAHDPRLQICAFNHASTWFGDVIWTGQSTRHIRAAFEQAELTEEQVRQLFLAVSPIAYMEKFASNKKQVLVVHATYDLTFLRKYSLEVLENFKRWKVDCVSRILPCGHYTTGESPYKFLDGWYLGSFIYKSFKRLLREASAPSPASSAQP